MICNLHTSSCKSDRCSEYIHLSTNGTAAINSQRLSVTDSKTRRILPIFRSGLQVSDTREFHRPGPGLVCFGPKVPCTNRDLGATLNHVHLLTGFDPVRKRDTY